MTALKNRSRQSGVALITILLIVAIAVVLGVTMTKQQHFAIKSARTNFDQTIARQYAYGGEVLARQILHKDYVDNPTGPDDLSEAWAQPDMKFEFDDGDGEVTFQIEDLQGRFNVNSLLQTGPSGILARRRLDLLLQELGLPNSYASRIYDWVDVNSESEGSSGAEDIDYLGLELPYRAADKAMSDLSELRLILELDRDQYKRIESYLIALPEGVANINVNTMSAPVMQALVTGRGITPLALSTAESIVANRNQGQFFAEVTDFTGNLALGRSAAGIDTTELSVNSSYFQVKIRARYQERYAYLTSIIQRYSDNNGTMRVIYRNQSKVILLD